jgi:hypothetical protein
VADLFERLLEAHDPAEDLRTVANPGPHQPVQMAGADSALGGDIGHVEASVRSLNGVERPGYDAVHLRTRKTVDEEPLKDVDRVGGRGRRRFLGRERAKRRAAQPDAASNHRFRRYPAHEQGHARTKAHADQRRGRCETAFLRADERTAQHPSRRTVAVDLERDCRTRIGYDADRRAALSGDHPDASDDRPQHGGGFDEAGYSPIDDSAGDAHSTYAGLQARSAR